MVGETGTVTLSMPPAASMHHADSVDAATRSSTLMSSPPSQEHQRRYHQRQPGRWRSDTRSIAARTNATITTSTNTATTTASATTEAASSTLFGHSALSSSQITAPSSEARSKGNRFFKCIIPCKRRCSGKSDVNIDEKEEIINDKEPLEWDTTIFPAEGFQAPSQKAGESSIQFSGGAAACLGQLFGKAQLDDSPGKSVEESCKRALEHFPQPSVEFSMPSLDFDFRLAVTLKPEPSRLEGAKAHKEITTISGGKWSGSFGNGNVLAGGYDLGQARGFRPIRIVEGAFVMQTTDEPPAVLEMRTRGSLSGPSDVLDALLSPRQPKDIDCRRYGFRMFSTIKTADKRYAEIVNCGLWVASGMWKDDEMIIDAYRVT